MLHLSWLSVGPAGWAATRIDDPDGCVAVDTMGDDWPAPDERMAMARLRGAAGTGPVADLIRQRRGGELRPLDELLLLSPPVAEGWSVLLSAIRGQLVLNASLRELVILRIGAVNGADYEWQAHVPVARACGVTDEQLGALGQPPGEEFDPAVFSPAERAVLAYADAMTVAVTVPPETFAAVHSLLPPREVAELTAVAATYNMVSRFLVALEIG
jgi:4-carboxymuconolactone decarboxylase